MPTNNNLKNVPLTINFPPLSSLITKNFLKTLLSDSDLKIFIGGRGTRKSISVAIYLIYRCITDPYFKCILYRNTLESIKSSQYDTIKAMTIELGVNKLFHFDDQNLKITFKHSKNGNCFISLGADSSWKSIFEPTIVWIEEEPPKTEFQETTLFNSIRSNRADVVKIYTVNPEFKINCSIEDFWFYKKYFEKYGGACEYIEERDIEVEYHGVKMTVKTKIEANHSFYWDNPYLPPSYIASLEKLQYVPDGGHSYKTQVLGHFSNKINDGRFYKGFTRIENTGVYTYNSEMPLCISFDFNVMPYCSMVVAQLYDNSECHIIDVIVTSYPNNNVINLCQIFKKKYGNHDKKVYIYGDVDGKKDNVLDQRTPYWMIQKNLSIFQTVMKVISYNKPVKLRGEWINACFLGNRAVKIRIDKNCTVLINELEQLPEEQDGTKNKRKITDAQTKQRYEQFGHTSDAMDYLLTVAYGDDFRDSYTRGVDDGWFGENRADMDIGRTNLRGV